MDNDDYNLMKAFMKQFYREREFPFKEILEMVFNVVMRMEREQFLGAEHYEQTGENRRGYANGYKPKRLATQVGMLDVQVPKTANHRDTPFYPRTLARGQRSSQAMLSAATEYYFQGVSTRNVETTFT